MITVKCCPNRPYCRCRTGTSFRNKEPLPANVSLASRLDDAGKYLDKYGKAVQASAAKPLPTKEWTPYTKKEHRQMIKRGTAYRLQGRAVSSTTFDYNPPAYREAGRRRHWARRPIMGRQPRPGATAIRMKRASIYGKGAVIRGVGKTLPIIGYGALAYSIAKDKNKPERIVKELMFFGFGEMSSRGSEQAAKDWAASKVTDHIIRKWFR